MGASHTIKLGQLNGQDIQRGTEATTADVADFVLVLDENDRLYCNGVHDEPSAWLVNSIQNNGWQKGETVKCVNRGKKGGALVLVVADGRSRIKATIAANVERVRNGHVPVRPEFVLVTEEEGYRLMHTSANKQERKPLFEARCWAHHKRIFAIEKHGKSSLEDNEVREARKEYAELRKCTAAQTKTWDLMLSAHPEVLRLFDDRAPGLNRAALLEIVNLKAFTDQPEAARRVIALELARKAPLEVPVVEVPPVDGPAAIIATDTAPAPEPVKPSRGTRSERTDRRTALGLDTKRPLTLRKMTELSILLRKEDNLDLVDPRVFLAMIMGETEFDGLPIDAHPSMKEVVRAAKQVGIDVSK